MSNDLDLERANRIARRQRLKHWWLPGFLVDPLRRCSHLRQLGIYGDEIIAAGYKRARCLDCGRLLPNLPPPHRDVSRRLPAPAVNPKFLRHG